MTHLQEGGNGKEVSEILFFSAKSKRRPSLIYSMQIIPVCLSIVARRKGVSATRRGGSNWTPNSLLVGHPCKLFHTLSRYSGVSRPACLRCMTALPSIPVQGQPSIGHCRGARGLNVGSSTEPESTRCRTAERPRQKQAGQAPSGNRGAARQRVHPEVHRESLQFFACQPRKLGEEARSQETEAVKSYGGFCTFEPLGPISCGS